MTPTLEGACPEPERLADFLGGVLEPASFVSLERHLSRCEPCQAALAVGLLSEVPGAPVRPQGPPPSAAQGRPAPFELRLEGAGAGSGEPPRPGLLLEDRYALEAAVWQGEAGEVWRARDGQLERTVAVKLLAVGEGQESGALRMLREARLLAQLRHRHVLRVYDTGLHSGRPFLVTEWLEGGTLADWLEAKKRSQKELLRLFGEAGEGLAAAHAAGIIHGDFQPGNVLLDAAGHAHVADFGLARARVATEAQAGAASGADPNVTLVPYPAEGRVSGSPAYLSPEQLEGQEPSAWSDQYAFCLALFEALTQARPFEAESLGEQLAQMRANRVVFPRKPRVSKALRRILRRGLASEPSKRFPDMRSLVEALREGPERSRRRWRTVRRVAAGVLVVGAVGAAWHFQERRLCGQGPQTLAARFGPAEEKALREAWDKGGVSPDAPGWKRVEERLSQFTAEWQSAFAGACRATRILREADEPTLQARLACLDAQAEQLRASGALAAEGGAQARTRAVAAFAELPRPQGCTQAELPFVERWLQGPAASLLRGPVHRLRVLRAVHAPEALEKEAQALLERAQRERLGPLEAEALLHLGVARAELGKSEEGLTQLRRAAALAEERGLDAVRARAWVEWARLSGLTLGRGDEAQLLLEQADAALRRLGGGRALTEEAQRLRGEVLLRQGRHAEAQAAFEEALETLRVRGREGHPAFVEVLLGLGRAQLAAQSTAPAAAHFQRAVEQATALYGPEHPTTGVALLELGTALLDAGRLTEAQGALEKARALVSTAQGVVAQRRLLAARALLATARGNLGQLEAALPELESLRAEARAQEGVTPSLEEVPRALAELYAFKGEASRARAVMREHLERLTAARGKAHPQVARAQCALGHVEFVRGDTEAALKTFEEGLLALPEKDRGEAAGWCLHAGIALARADLAEGEIEPHAGVVLERSVAAGTAAAKRNRAEALYARARWAYMSGEADKGRTLVQDALKELEGLEGVRLEAVRRVIRNLPTQAEEGELELFDRPRKKARSRR